MIHKVEEQGFRSNAEKRDQVGSSQRKGVPGYPRRREEKLLSWRIKTISCQRLCGAAGWGHYKCPLPGPLHPASVPAGCPPTNDGFVVMIHRFLYIFAPKAPKLWWTVSPWSHRQIRPPICRAPPRSASVFLPPLDPFYWTGKALLPPGAVFSMK